MTTFNQQPWRNLPVGSQPPSSACDLEDPYQPLCLINTVGINIKDVSTFIQLHCGPEDPYELGIPKWGLDSIILPTCLVQTSGHWGW